MKKSTKNTIENINAINAKQFTLEDAQDKAKTFRRITKQYNAAIEEIDTKMHYDLEECKQCKDFIKEFGKQEGDALFGKESSIDIISGVKLIRSTKQPAVDFAKLSKADLSKLAQKAPEALKIDFNKLPDELLAIVAPAVIHGDPSYTYTLKLVSEKSKK